MNSINTSSFTNIIREVNNSSSLSSKNKDQLTELFKKTILDFEKTKNSKSFNNDDIVQLYNSFKEIDNFFEKTIYGEEIANSKERWLRELAFSHNLCEPILINANVDFIEALHLTPIYPSNVVPHLTAQVKKEVFKEIANLTIFKNELNNIHALNMFIKFFAAEFNIDTKTRCFEVASTDSYILIDKSGFLMLISNALYPNQLDRKDQETIALNFITENFLTRYTEANLASKALEELNSPHFINLRRELSPILSNLAAERDSEIINQNFDGDPNEYFVTEYMHGNLFNEKAIKLLLSSEFEWIKQKQTAQEKFSIFSAKTFEDKGLVYKIFQRYPPIVRYFPQHLREDREFVKRLVAFHPQQLNAINPALETDVSFIKECVESSIKILDEISFELFEDGELITELLKINPKQVLLFAIEKFDISNCEEWILSLPEQKRDIIFYDRNFVEKLTLNNPEYFKYAPEFFQTNANFITQLLDLGASKDILEYVTDKECLNLLRSKGYA